MIKASKKHSKRLRVTANPVHIKQFAGAIAAEPKNIRLMSDLVIRRNQLLSMQTMEKNRIQILPASLHPTIKPMLTTIKNQITKLEEKLVKLIEDSPEYQAKNTILQSIPGIGNIAAASIISNVPELGYITNKQAASLIGVAPITRESGRYKGKRVCSKMVVTLNSMLRDGAMWNESTAKN